MLEILLYRFFQINWTNAFSCSLLQLARQLFRLLLVAGSQFDVNFAASCSLQNCRVDQNSSKSSFFLLQSPLSFCFFKVLFLSASSKSSFFLLLQSPLSFCFFKVLFLSASSKSSFFLLLQSPLSFCFFKVLFLSASSKSSFFLLLQSPLSFRPKKIIGPPQFPVNLVVSSEPTKTKRKRD